MGSSEVKGCHFFGMRSLTSKDTPGGLDRGEITRLGPKWPSSGSLLGLAAVKPVVKRVGGVRKGLVLGFMEKKFQWF